MRILVVGGTGTIGGAVSRHLADHDHQVVTVGRSGGDVRCDIADEDQLVGMWARVGSVDAVVSCAGEVTYAPLDRLSGADFLASFRQKGLAQINLVRTGLDHIAARGSFTLTSGIPSREPVVSSSAAAAVNGAIEAFARAAAIEIAPRRINVISPSVVAEVADAYDDVYPGFAPIALADLARAYRKSVEGAATAQVVPLP